MALPPSPSGLAALLCLIGSSVFSMRKRAATTWLDDLPSRAQMVAGRSSNWSGPMCYWNNATEQCLALAWARPQNAPISMCEPNTLTYAAGSYYNGEDLPESQCKTRVGLNGPCLWGPHWKDGPAGCMENSCYKVYDQASCEGSSLDCSWQNDTTEPYCEDSSHGQTHCWDLRDNVSCASGSGTVSGRRRSFSGSKNDQGTRCWWEAGDYGYGYCQESTGCHNYHAESTCQADPANWGNCQWSARVSQCLLMDSCEEYDTESTCTADAFGVGEKTFPGARCQWKHGSQLAVGREVRLDLWNQAETSQVLRIKSDRTLDSFPEGNNTVNFWKLREHLGLQERWEERAKAVQFVLNDTTGLVMNWSDIPTPIPDGLTLFFGSCQDNLPPRERNSGGAWGLQTACNHHSQETCSSATDIFPCPSYCGWASCWMSNCKEHCATCK